MSPHVRHCVYSLPQALGLRCPISPRSGALSSLGQPGGGQP